MFERDKLELEIVDFENKPSTNTPLSATNLIKMQNNIKNILDVIQDNTIEDILNLSAILDSVRNYNYDLEWVGKWISGKNINRKVINVNLPSETNSWVVVYKNVVDNIEELISIRGSFYYGGSYHVLPLAEGSYFVTFEIKNGDLYCKRNGWGAASAKIVIEYTMGNSSVG